MFRYCPMRMNWREIPDTVRYCNERGIMLMYNQVDSPMDLSLHTMSTNELRSVVSFLEADPPQEGTDKVIAHNHQHYWELVRRLEGFLGRENRVNMLRARVSVSDAVTGQYTREKWESASDRVRVPELEESTNLLILAAKRYLTVRLNVDLTLATDGELPADVLGVESDRRAELLALLEDAGYKRFVKSFLNEVVRTYSGIWGVMKPHDVEIFEHIEGFSTELAGHDDARAVIAGLVQAPPRELYDAMLTESGAELSGLLFSMAEPFPA